jgi:hypothetical protein
MLVIDKLYDKFVEFNQPETASRETRGIFSDSLQELIDTADQWTDLPRSAVEYQLNQELTEDEFYKCFDQFHESIGFKLRELFDKLELKQNLPSGSIDLFKKTLLAKILEKFPKQYEF